MKVCLELGQKSVHLLLTPSGHYALGPEEKDYEKSLEFEDEKLGRLALLYSGSGVGLGKFLELLRILALVDRGAYLLAYCEAKSWVDEDLLEVVKGVWSEKIYKNLVVEVLLGSFSNEELPISEDPEGLARELFEEGGVYHTRVVGLRYRIEKLKDDEGKLKVKEGDKVYVVWEQGNEHDENALAVYHMSGVKMGYIRRTISKILVEKVKDTGHLEGEVSLIWEEEYYPEICLSLNIPA